MEESDFVVEIEWRGARVKTLRDLVRPGLRVWIVGVNPSLNSVRVGHYYQGALGKRLWAALEKCGVVSAPARGQYHD